MGSIYRDNSNNRVLLYDNKNVLLDSERYCTGTTYGGGVVFYTWSGCTHGLIAATQDIVGAPGAPWGCDETLIGTSTSIGSGLQNSINIYNNCSTAGIAARLCLDWSFSGYTDWYLPSKDELTQMCLMADIIGGFNKSVAYWSSSERSTEPARVAWFYYWGSGYSSDYKYFQENVRAIRQF